MYVAYLRCRQCDINYTYLDKIADLVKLTENNSELTVL